MSGENSASDNETASAVNVNQPTFNAPGISGSNNKTTINNTNQFQPRYQFVTTNVVNDQHYVRKFNEEAFTNYLKKLKREYQDNTRKIPAIWKTSLRDRFKTMKGSERITDLHHLFPNGIRANTLFGLVGEDDSDKTTLLKKIQELFIDLGYFPFPIIGKKLGKDKTKFAYFVRMNGYKDFPIGDLQRFSEWLNKKQKRIIFLINGLDEASFDLSANIQTVNVGECASAHTWIAQLISHEIMTESMVVFTTRSASVSKLPIEQRPDFLYTLDELDGGRSMDSSAIVAVIKNPSAENFPKIRFVDDMNKMFNNMSSKRSSSAEVTITSLYDNALQEKNKLTHNPHNETREENKKVQDRVDAFYLEKFFNNNRLDFTEDELNKRGLSIEKIQDHSLVDVNKKVVEPLHLSVAEFHSARSIWQTEDVEQFKKVVDELFVLDDQVRKTLTRRFLAGLIDPKTDEEKQKVFLDRLAKEIRMAEDLTRKYEGDKYWQALQLQGHLLNDLAELQADMLELVRKKFSTNSKLDMRVKLQDASMLDAIIKFMKTMQPEFDMLSVHFHDDLKNEDLSRFINAVVNLPTNVEQMQILDIVNFDTHVLKKLVGKVNISLELRPKNEVDASKIDHLKTSLQREMDLRQSRSMIVQLEHRRRSTLLRHSSYTDTSSTPILQLPSHLWRNNKTLNLSKEIPGFDGQRFDFVISESHEIKTLSQILATTPDITIHCLQVFLPYRVNMNLMKQFCKNISKLENKVVTIRMYNLEEHVGFDEIKLLMEQCKRNLELRFIRNINETAGEQLERMLDSVHKSKTRGLYVRIHFKNYLINFLPLSQ